MIQQHAGIAGMNAPTEAMTPPSSMKGTVTHDATPPKLTTGQVYSSIFSSPMWIVLLVVLVFSLVGYFVLKWWADYYVKKRTDRLLDSFRKQEGLDSDSTEHESGSGDE